jgi:hypothetical protein
MNVEYWALRVYFVQYIFVLFWGEDWGVTTSVVYSCQLVWRWRWNFWLLFLVGSRQNCWDMIFVFMRRESTFSLGYNTTQKALFEISVTTCNLYLLKAIADPWLLHGDMYSIRHLASSFVQGASEIPFNFRTGRQTTAKWRTIGDTWNMRLFSLGAG